MSLLDRFLGGSRNKACSEGVALLEKEKYAEAVDRLREASLGRSDHPSGSLASFHFRQALVARGRELLRSGDPSGSESLFAEAVGLWDQYPDLHCLHGAHGGGLEWSAAGGQERPASQPRLRRSTTARGACTHEAGPSARSLREPERPGGIGPSCRALAHRRAGLRRRLFRRHPARGPGEPADLLDQRSVGKGRGGVRGCAVPGRPVGRGSRTFCRPGPQTPPLSRLPNPPWGGPVPPGPQRGGPRRG